MPERDAVGKILPDPAAMPHAGTSCSEEFAKFGMTNVTPGSDITEFSQAIVQFGTGGSLTSTIRDLLTWAKTGTGDGLLSDAMVQQRHLYNNAIDTIRMYGMTQYKFVNDTGDLSSNGLEGLVGWVGHDGDAFGFATTAYKNEDVGSGAAAAIATAANTCAFSLRSWLFVDAYNSELLKRQLEETTTNSTAPPETTTTTTTTTPTMSPAAVPGTTPPTVPGVHPDIVEIRNVTGRIPGGVSWADSFSVGNECYCYTNFDHNIGTVIVQTSIQGLGNMTVKQICDRLGPGPGIDGRPVYNDIQCGNGPANDAGDEVDCPGRVDIGIDGCGHIGPKWNLTRLVPPPATLPATEAPSVPAAPTTQPSTSTTSSGEHLLDGRRRGKYVLAVTLATAWISLL
jgi:hypothetical protein